MLSMLVLFNTLKKKYKFGDISSKKELNAKCTLELILRSLLSI
jgi:hypothetical protein